MSDLDALEFLTPATLNTKQFNRNIRKFRLLQYDPDGSGLQPLLVGTYAVDPLTGQPVTTQNLGLPYSYVQSTVTNGDITAVNGIAGHQFTIYKLIVDATTNVTPANGFIALASSGASGVFHDIQLASNFQTVERDFGPNGFLCPDIGASLIWKTSTVCNYLGTILYS